LPVSNEVTKMAKAAHNHSLSVKAYSILRRRILRGELALGEVVSRRKIGAELGMSLLPVMEAMLRLEVEGFLESRPRAGTRIRIPTLEDVEGHFIIREALETQSAKLYTQSATESERAAMEKLAVRVDEAYQVGPMQFVGLHQAFHRRIVECTHCLPLQKAVENTQALWSTWVCALVPRLPAHSERGRDHQDLMEALNHGTPEQAAEKIRGHVTLGLRQIEDGLEPYFRLSQIRGNTYSRSAEKHR
jgi:DNA-binding GntR family transcriptional regulator